MAIALVTDSTSDITPEEAKQLGIPVVPLFVLFGDRSYRDYVDLSRAEFFEKLISESALPATSQPTAAMFEEVFSPIIDGGDEVLYIGVSASLSGTINAARAGAQAFAPSAVTIYDSQSASGGLRLQVMRAHDLAKRGATTAEILAALDRERSSQRLYACIPDLSHLLRMGRIGRAKAVIGGLMKIVPVLSLKDGHVAAEAQVRTLARAQETMIELALANAGTGPDAQYTIVHTNARALAERVLEQVRARFVHEPQNRITILEAGPAIATHIGVGALGIFCTRE